VEAVRFHDPQPHHALAGLLIAASLVAGCGGEAQHPHRAAANPCPPAPGPLSAKAPDTTCRYAVGDGRVAVTFDRAPQAYFRWIRAQVERQQTATMWSHTPSQAPHPVAHVGAGAFWVRGPRELVATDRHELLTVRVLRAPAGTTSRALATTVARRILRAG